MSDTITAGKQDSDETSNLSGIQGTDPEWRNPRRKCASFYEGTG
ncbi:hypothetical protein [Pectinatus frisingensis]